MKKDEEIKKAEVKDLSLTLFRKIAVLLGASMLNAFSDNGYFVYNQHKPRVVMVFPEGNKLSYWFIKIRMRSLEPRYLGRLARIYKTPYNTVYLQPKVLDHEEYEHLIELLQGGELENGQKRGEEVIKNGLPKDNCNR